MKCHAEEALGGFCEVKWLAKCLSLDYYDQAEVWISVGRDVGAIQQSLLSGLSEEFDKSSGWFAVPRYKTTADILKIVYNKDQVRNLGVIAHT